MNLMQKNLIAILVGVLFTLISQQNASAYYDPGVQRWINRDPIGGGQDLYSFVRNNPETQIDLFGLWSIGAPTDDNTMECDGKGGIRIKYSSKNPAKTPKCIIKCMDVHENSHIQDVLKANPDICKNQRPGAQIYNAGGQEQKDTERKASQAEIDCLNDAAKCPSKDCPANWVNDRIKQMKDYRDKF